MNEENRDVTRNNTLSNMDMAYMVISYPRLVPHPDAPEWTLDHALEIAQVPATKRTSLRRHILAEANSIEIEEWRSEFNNWSKSRQAVSQDQPVATGSFLSRLFTRSQARRVKVRA